MGLRFQRKIAEIIIFSAQNLEKRVSFRSGETVHEGEHRATLVRIAKKIIRRKPAGNLETRFQNTPLAKKETGIRP